MDAIGPLLGLYVVALLVAVALAPASWDRADILLGGIALAAFAVLYGAIMRRDD